MSIEERAMVLRDEINPKYGGATYDLIMLALQAERNDMREMAARKSDLAAMRANAIGNNNGWRTAESVAKEIRDLK